MVSNGNTVCDFPFDDGFTALINVFYRLSDSVKPMTCGEVEPTLGEIVKAILVCGDADRDDPGVAATFTNNTSLITLTSITGFTSNTRQHS